MDPNTGAVSFVADPNAPSGELTPIEYRVTDRNGQTSTARLTPIVAPPGTPTDDTNSGARDQNQTFRPLDNDTPTSQAQWDPATLRLCGGNEQAPNCSQTSIDVPGEGTYTVQPNGTIIFDPLPTFTGTAKPVRYQVTDTLGRVYNARLLALVNGRRPTLPITGSDNTSPTLIVSAALIMIGMLVTRARRRNQLTRRH